MSETISIAEFKKLRKEGRVGKSAKGSKAKEEMWEAVKRTGKLAMNEYKFSEDRKFKFDFALPIEKIAIEYEGLGLQTNKSGNVDKSGHTTVTGYTSNCEKYNLATCLGWRVLRYTALNYKDLESDLMKLLKL